MFLIIFVFHSIGHQNPVRGITFAPEGIMVLRCVRGAPVTQAISLPPNPISRYVFLRIQRSLSVVVLGLPEAPISLR